MTPRGSNSLSDLEQVLEEVTAVGMDGCGGAVIRQYATRELATTLSVVAKGTCHTERWREPTPSWIEWPHPAVQLLWVGDVVKQSDSMELVSLGPLADAGLSLLPVRCIVWRKGAPVWAERDGDQTPKVAILEPERARADDLWQAWRDLELVGRVAPNHGRGGRPRAHDLWSAEFARKWRKFVDEHDGRRPKEREMAGAMAHSVEYLKKRFREVIGRPEGVTWETYEPPR